METITVLGLIALLTGIVIRYVIARRRFYRRGVGGLQEFSSFERSVGIRFLERILRLVSTLLIIVGLCFLFIGWYNNRTAAKYKAEQKKVVTP